MAFERKWQAVPPVAFTSTGTSRGQITVTSTLGFKVKQIVVLNHPSQPALELEVKRVSSLTQMELGPTGKITDRSDLSSYDNTTFIYANEQNKTGPTSTEHYDAIYEQEPTVADRVIQVDPSGNFYTPANPLPVQLSDGSINIETLNAELRVQLSAKDNDPKAGDVHSSVRIGDGAHELSVNADGSINANIVQSTSVSVAGLKTFYNEALIVASGVETTVLSVTATGADGYRFTKVEVSGENVAVIKLKISGTVFAQKRLWWNHFNETFNFENFTNGLKIDQGQTLTVTAYHTRPMAGNFNATAYAE